MIASLPCAVAFRTEQRREPRSTFTDASQQLHLSETPSVQIDSGGAVRKGVVGIAALYLVTLVFMFAVVGFAGGDSTSPGTPSHEQMDPVSHSEYELHKSIGHVS